MVRTVFESVGKDGSAIAGSKNIDEAMIEFAKTAPFSKTPGLLRRRRI
jgi:hypothetical protein